MRATDFEFRHRFWIIVALFVVAFGLYHVDPVDAGERVLRWMGAGRVGAEARGRLRDVFLAGSAVIFVAALVRTWAAAYLRSDVVRDSRLHAERLVADGPYRYVRNPLYLGTILMAVGLAPLASLTGAGVLVVGMVLFAARLIGREEAELAATQGPGYEAYRAAVPRMLPALLPRVPASGARPRWAQAVVGEIFIWTFAVGTLVLAVTLNSRMGMGVWSAGFIVYLLQQTASRAHEREGAGKKRTGPSA